MSDIRSSLRCIATYLTTLLLATYAGIISAVEKTPAAVPDLAGEPLAAGSLGKTVLGLAVVVLLIVGMAWLMRRMGGMPGSSSAGLRVLGGLSMGTRERVVLIQVGETQLLLGVAPGRVQTLHVLEEKLEMPEPGKSGTGNFAANLTAALQRGKKS